MITPRLINFSTRKPLKIIIFFAMALLLCLITLFKIPVEMMPKTDSKTISITTRVRGGLPADQTENMITVPLEKEFSTIAGISSITSVSKDSESTIIIYFRENTDMNTAFIEINQLYEKTRHILPKETMPPAIAMYNQHDAPIYIVSLHSETKSTEEIRSLAEKNIKPDFLRLHGVANVEIAGGRSKKIIIDLSEKKLIKRGLSIFDITANIKKNNQALLTGKINTSDHSFSVRTDASYKNIAEIENLIVATSRQKDIVRLKDIADISYGYTDAVDIARINGRSSVCLYIQKQSDANTINVCRQIASTTKKLAEQYTSIVSFKTVSDKSKFIKKSLNALTVALLTGIMLAFIIVFCFLQNPYSSLFVCLSIPLSLSFSVAALYFTNFTLNIISISGLALGTGMLVDCAIVVTENIARKAEGIKNYKTAVSRAVRELTVPLTASTASTVIVFIPMLLADENTRNLYAPLASSVTFSLGFSLIISLILLPALSAKYNNKTTSTNVKNSFGKIFLSPYIKTLIKSYKKQKLIFTGLTILSLLSVLFVWNAPKDISPFGKDNKFTVFVELKSGARLDIADQAVKEVETILNTIPEIEKTIVRIERWSGKIYVTLKDNIKDSKQAIMQRCEKLLYHVGAAQKAFIYLSQAKDSADDELVLNIYGHNYPAMLKAAGMIHDTLKQDTDFFNFKYRYKPGRPEKIIKITPEKALLAGFTNREIAEKLHAKIRGLIASEIFEEGKENEIIVRVNSNDRLTIKQITNLNLINSNGQRIPLKSIATIEDSTSPSQIWHLNQKRMIQVSFSMRSYTLENAAILTKKYLSNTTLPEKSFYQFDTSYQNLKKSYTNLKLALMAMLVFVYMILASVFENYTSPLKIMLSLIFALPGIAISLIFTNLTFSLGSLTGCMILGGICINNAIIMADSFNNIHKKYKSNVNAAINAAGQRLRPIILTTTTTIAGLLPLVFQTANSSTTYRDMSITVILGLTCSTMMILLVFPQMLSTKK